MRGSRVKNVGAGELETCGGKGGGREWVCRVERGVCCGEGRTWRVVPQEKPLELHGACGGCGGRAKPSVRGRVGGSFAAERGDKALGWGKPSARYGLSDGLAAASTLRRALPFPLATFPRAASRRASPSQWPGSRNRTPTAHLHRPTRLLPRPTHTARHKPNHTHKRHCSQPPQAHPSPTPGPAVAYDFCRALRIWARVYEKGFNLLKQLPL